MALTFPDEFPGYYVGGVNMSLPRADLTTIDGGGTLSGVELGHHLWRAQFDAVATRDIEHNRWAAWIRRHDGAAQAFHMIDPTRVWPAAYPSGWATSFPSFSGAASSWSVDTDRTTLTLNGLPSGFVITDSDLIGFKWGSSNVYRHMVEAQEAVSVSGSGIAILRVTPAVWAWVDSGATAYLNRVSVRMKMMVDTSMGDLGAGTGGGGRIVAVQDPAY